MKNYILRQIDGHIIAESEYISEVIEQLVEFKLREIDRYNVSIEEKIHFDRYPYMNELYSLYTQAFNYNEDNFKQVEIIYNNSNHIPRDEYIKLEVSNYV